MEEKIAYASPERFESDTWDPERNRSVGGGDIANSYSGDKIANDNAFRRPFKWIDGLRISVGGGWIDGKSQGMKTYRIVPIETYKDEIFDYPGKPDAFTYEGMRVKKGKQEFVMTDELHILPRPEEKTVEQLSLF